MGGNIFGVYFIPGPISHRIFLSIQLRGKYHVNVNEILTKWSWQNVVHVATAELTYYL